MRTALTIAGSDSGGGAGIQADLKTFAAHGVFGTTAITAVTAQNTLGVVSVVPLTPASVIAQIEAVVTDIGVHAAKTGMLATAGIVEAVAVTLHDLRVPYLVVDPVLLATSGSRLLDEDAVAVMKARLFPGAHVVTPNLPEAEALSGVAIRTDHDRREAARRILALGPSHVLVTGGHAPTGDIVDLLYDGRSFLEFRVERQPGPACHGTGCTFSASLAAHLALGRTLVEAIPRAQAYVAEAIRASPDLGRGSRLLQHFWRQDVDRAGRL